MSSEHASARALTREQQCVIAHGTGHARVTAVAGAGKTTTMVARVEHLLAAGVAAPRVMVLMFNRQAKDDFSRKLSQTLAGAYPMPQVRTFHSIGHRLTQTLTRWGALAPRQLIQADWQRERLLKQAVGAVIGEDRERLEWALEPERLEEFGQFCELVKAELVTPEALFERDGYGREARYYIEAYAELQQSMEAQGLMTYSDLLFRPYQALLTDPALRQRVQGFVEHIIVDEYQDINEGQLQLLAQIAGPDASIMAVGDADQCIYEWRGARPDAMSEAFTRTFGDSTQFALPHTFRHGHRIALMANHLIRHNPRTDRPLCVAAPSTPSSTFERVSTLEQALTTLKDASELSNTAVLVRHWSLSVPVQLQLLRAGIPFQVGRQERFVFRLPLVQALAGYLELARSPRLIHEPEHLLLLFAQPTPFVARERLQVLCRQLALQNAWFERGDPMLNGLSRAQQRTLKKRWQLIDDLARNASRWTPATVLSHVIDTLNAHEVLKRAAARPDKGEEDGRLLDVLLEQARVMESDPAGFINMLKAPIEDRNDGVVVSTVHGAKGLEWDRVILFGLNEEDFPFYHRDSPLTPSRLLEERRLFYVGITRARSRLTLVCEPGQTLSRFVDECAPECANRIAEALASEVGDTPVAVSEPALAARYAEAVGASTVAFEPMTYGGGDSSSVAGAQATNWVAGQAIIHDVFGAGTIEAIEGEGARTILTVRFDKAGTRKLVADRAPLRSGR
ncbi:ATP-dependent helicase [Larsenimonas salina]|uniref:ATP-dependent helicase n=1 Tax=Larsenimonas salina TaxID=1295565 RepID=UPI002073A70C|nr:ATP-dependent helicase [Larsenimonas salina]MCM5703238.1 ATP-dependent helicase [Larsenimonas salina]